LNGVDLEAVGGHTFTFCRADARRGAEDAQFKGFAVSSHGRPPVSPQVVVYETFDAMIFKKAVQVITQTLIGAQVSKLLI